MSNIDDPVVNLTSVYGFLAVQWVILLVLWWYLEQVVPSEWGVAKHPLFFLKWFGIGKSKEEPSSYEKLENMPPDVSAESRRVFDPESQNDYAVRVLEMKKTYPSIDGNPPKTAVKNISFGVQHNTCHGILGHTGAGKVRATTIYQLIYCLYRQRY